MSNQQPDQDFKDLIFQKVNDILQLEVSNIEKAAALGQAIIDAYDLGYETGRQDYIDNMDYGNHNLPQ